jgi:hypothetical protein
MGNMKPIPAEYPYFRFLRIIVDGYQPFALLFGVFWNSDGVPRLLLLGMICSLVRDTFHCFKQMILYLLSNPCHHKMLQCMEIKHLNSSQACFFNTHKVPTPS